MISRVFSLFFSVLALTIASHGPSLEPISGPETSFLQFSDNIFPLISTDIEVSIIDSMAVVHFEYKFTSLATISQPGFFNFPITPDVTIEEFRASKSESSVHISFVDVVAEDVTFVDLVNHPQADEFGFPDNFSVFLGVINPAEDIIVNLTVVQVLKIQDGHLMFLVPNQLFVPKEDQQDTIYEWNFMLKLQDRKHIKSTASLTYDAIQDTDYSSGSDSPIEVFKFANQIGLIPDQDILFDVTLTDASKPMVMYQEGDDAVAVRISLQPEFDFNDAESENIEYIFLVDTRAKISEEVLSQISTVVSDMSDRDLFNIVYMDQDYKTLSPTSQTPGDFHEEIKSLTQRNEGRLDLFEVLLWISANLPADEYFSRNILFITDSSTSQMNSDLLEYVLSNRLSFRFSTISLDYPLPARLIAMAKASNGVSLEAESRSLDQSLQQVQDRISHQFSQVESIVWTDSENVINFSFPQIVFDDEVLEVYALLTRSDWSANGVTITMRSNTSQFEDQFEIQLDDMDNHRIEDINLFKPTTRAIIRNLESQSGDEETIKKLSLKYGVRSSQVLVVSEFFQESRDLAARSQNMSADNSNEDRSPVHQPSKFSTESNKLESNSATDMALKGQFLAIAFVFAIFLA